MGLCTNQINQIKFNEMQVVEERGKPEYSGKNLSEQRRELTNLNSPHVFFLKFLCFLDILCTGYKVYNNDYCSFLFFYFLVNMHSYFLCAAN